MMSVVGSRFIDVDQIAGHRGRRLSSRRAPILHRPLRPNCVRAVGHANAGGASRNRPAGHGASGYFANLSCRAPKWIAWRTWALSNAARPNSYVPSRLSNWTSYLLPVTSLREMTAVHLPLSHLIAAAMSPRSPANGATRIDAT